MRDVRRQKRTGAAHVRECLVERLLGQRVHEIEVEIIKTGRAQLIDGAVSVLGTMDAAEPRERMRREGLRSQRHAIDAGGAVAREAPTLDGSGVGLERHLGIDGDPAARRECLEQACECVGREQARRAAAEENGLDWAAAEIRKLRLEVTDQRVDVVAGGAADLSW